MLARLEAHVAEQQRFAANASHELRTPLAVTQTLLDLARKDPSRDPRELVDSLQAINTRAIDLTEALLMLSRADQGPVTREPVDLSLLAEEATETLLPFAESLGIRIETSGDVAATLGSPALLLPMTTNLVHNAIVHNLPDHGSVWVTTSIQSSSVLLTVENTGEELAATRRHPRRALPTWQRADPHPPRRRRPGPGHRRPHRTCSRRHPHPQRSTGWGTLRHGPAAGGSEEPAPVAHDGAPQRDSISVD